jgi:tight adherence protein C
VTRLISICVLGLWAGGTLLLSEMTWFRQLPLAERLRPFVVGGLRHSSSSGAFAKRSFKDVLSPLATHMGARISRGLGIGEELSARLERVHASQTIAEFRARQVGAATGALTASALVCLIAGPPAPLALLLLVGGPLLVFAWIEQKLASAARDHQRRVFIELPVVAEQLGMLLSSGYSMTGALSRLAVRGDGACALDLRRLVGRIGQGVSPEDGLREWARTVEVPELHQLVTILLLHHDAGDLGDLISQEARSIRREAQRWLIERIERRNEQVWIPVTIATLVPGVIFLAVPFVDALGSFEAL